MRLVRIGPLPDDPLAAAAAFYGDWLPSFAGGPAKDDLLIVFPAADHTHRAWRLAAVQGLARSRVPGRVNAAQGDDPTILDAAAAYLASAPGLTGQVLPLDGAGAGPVIV